MHDTDFDLCAWEKLYNRSLAGDLVSEAVPFFERSENVELNSESIYMRHENQWWKETAIYFPPFFQNKLNF